MVYSPDRDVQVHEERGRRWCEWNKAGKNWPGQKGEYVECKDGRCWICFKGYYWAVGEKTKYLGSIAHILYRVPIKTLVQILVERSPLKYTDVGSLSALDPRGVVRDPETAGNTFERLLSKLLSLRRFSADECDQAKQQFESLLKEVNNYHKNECKSSDPVSQSLDTFYFELLDDKDSLFCGKWLRWYWFWVMAKQILKEAFW